ncbi:MAG: FG-GAP-like repeat-containing protein [Thermoanaerobaculia bacterium]|nr:FG-GAP-like repeat-containing protein [Thermoanaerobaculia bacterium]
MTSTPTATHARSRYMFSPIVLSTMFCLGALCLLPGSADAQLTVTDNLLLRQDDFDINSLEASNFFGTAVATCDFDGDGYQDLAIGASGTTVLGVIADAGAVYVAYGGAGGLTVAGGQTLTQPPTGSDPPEVTDFFGNSLAAGDFNGDGWCDLAAGAFREDLPFAVDAGSVHVFSGTANGLTSTSQVWTQDSPGVQDEAEHLEHFGIRLAAGDFDADGFADLAVTVQENSFAGAVHVLFGGLAGLDTIRDDFIFQGDPLGTSGVQEDSDNFGYALAVGHFDADPYADLAIGAPGEDWVFDDVGWVYVFYGDAVGFVGRRHEFFDQSDIGQPIELDDGFGSSLVSGDFDGDGIDDLAITSTGEGVGLPGAEAQFAGSVAVLYGTPVGLSTVVAEVWTQDSDSVSDQAESFDSFGSGLASGDFDGDGRADLGIGVSQEDFEGGGHVDNGAVHAFYGSELGLSPAQGEQYHGQGGWGAGTTESGDYFGSVMTTGDFNRDGGAALIVGIPSEGVDGKSNAGVVVVITELPIPPIFVDGFETGDASAWGTPP